MFKNKFLKFGAYVGSLAVSSLPVSVLAAAPPLGDSAGLAGSKQTLTDIKTTAGIGVGAQDLPSLIGRFIAIILSVVGIILVFIIVQAGITYMTANGDDAKIKEAKKRITQAVVGIILILAAYSISNFVINQLISVAS